MTEQMSVGIDAYVSGKARLGGFFHYVKNVILGLSEHHDIELTCFLAAGQEARFDQDLEVPGVRWRVLDYTPLPSVARLDRDSKWHQGVLRQALESEPVDVLLGTSFFAPVAWKGATVVTVHDLIFEREPELFEPDNLALYTTWAEECARRATGLIAVSSATAGDVRQYWEGIRTPISVVHLPPTIRPTTSKQESREFVAEHYIDRSFILNVGATHQRKNVRGVLDVYSRLRYETRKDHALVLMNADAPIVWAALENFPFRDEVIVTGWLSDQEAAHLYNAATVLLHPALLEGFGLPVLDAMTCGTPVVASDRSAIPEIAGDGAWLIDPDRPEEMARALDKIIADKELYSQLSARGRARSEAFSTRNFSVATRGAIEESLQRYREMST